MKDPIKILKELVQLDVDAVGAYSAAIERIEVESVSEQLRSFQRDHARHIIELNAELGRLGEDRVASIPDAKGAVLKGFTAITSLMGTSAALTAMLANEELTNRSYKTALEHEWQPAQRLLLEQNYSDEQRHLEWIKSALKNRIVWEEEAHP